MELYHITNKKNIESITKNGLRPNIGSHSKKLETKPALCLTEKKLYQLSMCDDPHTRKIRRKIEKLITKAFDSCLDMYTGGWSDVT